MKKIVLLSILLSLFACRKDKVEKQIAGTWEYRQTTGFIYQPPSPAGNGNIIVMGDDGSFERKKHDTLLFRGRYKLEGQKDCIGETQWSFTTDDASFGSGRFVSVQRDNLFFSASTCIDGATTIYARIQ